MGAAHQRAGHQSRLALDDPRYSLTLVPRMAALTGLHLGDSLPMSAFGQTGVGADIAQGGF